MARPFVPVDSVRRAADRTGWRLRRWLARHERLSAGLAGVSVTLGAALLLVPFRAALGTAAVAAALALVVMLSSLRWGRVAALASASTAGLSYALFHALPHGLPWVEDLQDLATVLVLVGIGLAGASARERLLTAEHVSMQQRHALQWLHMVGERAISDRSIEELSEGACDAVRTELGLESCRLVMTGLLEEIPTLEHSGLMVDTAGRPMRHGARGTPDARPATVDGRPSTLRFQLPVRYGDEVLARFDCETRGDLVPPSHGCMAAVVVADVLALVIERTAEARPQDLTHDTPS